MSARDSIPLTIRPGQIWRTAAGHLIKIYRDYGPPGNYSHPHSGEYINGPVNGYRRQTFTNEGLTGLDRNRDSLAELISE